jgi:uncharacterized membrane protein YsdA (DUF1294 family)
MTSEMKGSHYDKYYTGSGGRKKGSAYRIFGIAAAVLLLGGGIALLVATDWDPLLIWLVAVNTVTFILYGVDKYLAIHDRLRIPEIVLHLLSLGGGFIGGWTGRLAFHHKTRKPVFTAVLIVSTLLWIAILGFTGNFTK